MLRVLLKLLEQSRENRTLAVAASDLGHFISAHPHGRNIVTGAAHPHASILPACQLLGLCVQIMFFLRSTRA